MIRSLDFVRGASDGFCLNKLQVGYSTIPMSLLFDVRATRKSGISHLTVSRNQSLPGHLHSTKRIIIVKTLRVYSFTSMKSYYLAMQYCHSAAYNPIRGQYTRCHSLLRASINVPFASLLRCCATR